MTYENVYQPRLKYLLFPRTHASSLCTVGPCTPLCQRVLECFRNIVRGPLPVLLQLPVSQVSLSRTRRYGIVFQASLRMSQNTARRKNNHVVNNKTAEVSTQKTQQRQKKKWQMGWILLGTTVWFSNKNPVDFPCKIRTALPGRL